MNSSSKEIYCKKSWGLGVKTPLSLMLALFLAIVFACSVALAQEPQACSYPGQTYAFSTECNDDWEYKWTATGGSFVDGKDDACTVNWLAPPVTEESTFT